LNLDTVIVKDAGGERRIQGDALPMRIGTGTDCELRIPGPGSAVVATLDQLDGRPFLQPGARAADLRVNGDSLRSSRALNAGDTLEYYGTRIQVELGDGELSLLVQLEGSAYITRPPELPDAGAAAEETIAPSAFKRAADVRPQAQPRKLYIWQSAVALGIFLLIGLSWLLFTSRSIQFEVHPGGADALEVRGGWFQLPLADRILLREGSYSVHVEKTGYYDVNQSLQVDATPSRTVVIEMRKLPGSLTVQTDPDINAMVTVNRTMIGRAPYGPVELEPGTHLVTVTADNYLPYEYNLSVPGLGISQLLDVQLVPRWAEVEVSSEPAGAAIYRGEELLGETPMRLQLNEGSHDLTVVKEGFRAWDGVIDAVANVKQQLPLIRLQPANAQLLVNSIPLGANVSVDGRYRGQAPVRLALAPGVDYQIGLSKAGYGSTVRSVRLQAAASEAITVDLSARTGTVSINVLPEDAVVYLDGRPRGTGSVSLELPSAPHALEVRKEGFETFSRSVTPRPGFPQTIQVRLLSDEEVRLRSVATTVSTSQGQVMRRVEPGSFTMGASRSQQGRRANEVLVPVTITKPYYIGTKEVTNTEFLRFRPNHDSGGDIHPSLAGNNNPVVNVSWADAVEYCNWLSLQEGLTPAYEKRFEKWEMVQPTPDGYRLPTEAEWEWAIRYQGRSEATVFPWGNRLPPRRDSGNYADKSASELVPSILPGFDDGYASTAPVGSFPANALGIYDGGGNVAEWVQDYYAVPTPGQTTAVEDPLGPNRAAHHVIRGSSWRHAGITELRLSYREFGSNGRIDLGFRLARSAL
jgi:formylglycine-generating enzyme required for sulfatase activity